MDSEAPCPPDLFRETRESYHRKPTDKTPVWVGGREVEAQSLKTV